MEVSFRLNTTEGFGEIRCLISVGVGFAGGFNPMIFTVTSNFMLVELSFSLVTSRLQEIAEDCRLFFVFLQTTFYSV